MGEERKIGQNRMRSKGKERQGIHENDSGQAAAMQRNGENHQGGQKDREGTRMITTND